MVKGRVSPTLRSIAACAVALSVVAAPLAADAKPRTGALRSPGEAAIVAPPNGPLLIVVSIKRQKVRVFDVNGEIASSRVSTGRPGFDTPTGVFSILEKNVYHQSNIYSGASMPYQERITWSGIALHAGVVPGFRASHGCIRLPYSFSRKLYGLTKIGNRVIVTADDDAEPMAFESPKLFKPLPLDDATAMKSDPSKPAQLAVNDQPDDNSTSDALPELPRLIGVSPALIRAVADMPRDPQRRPTTRNEADQIIQEKLDRARAAAKTAQAAQTAAEDKAKSTAKDFDSASQRFDMARRSIEPLRTAVKAAEARQQDAMKAFEAYMSGGSAATKSPSQVNARPDSQSDNAKDREGELEDAVLDLTIEADKARADAAQNEMSFAEVQAAYSAAQTARDNAAEALRDAQTDLSSVQASLTDANREMRLRSKPIAVLVSLRAQRLYIRQGTEPLLEAPIAVGPLPNKVGTHVFTAMRYGADPNTFDWRLVSAQTPAPGQPFDEGAKKKRNRTALAQGRSLNVQMAMQALDAFTIPDDILQTITELARPGSSLIVSDRELPLNENGSGTEFVVLTR